ncbi:uncharacterized protein K460DRAFT_366081 [Cucurbitaria berberidis CBS 394.84]|uniref:N-acetyltransferase domain-containing protein n=1 Tax=Cucurbitaria berberidis CBS 394.84 TaxID=1168544 RepID=A0A9P4L8C6_9PLEO|nr:uncharacterized protein K460DRAFT_366081 [Cucurbitaria berberidis CBS 394.84]KAF1845197.1 hypothetical protein K460DRAFT_366081 [Cucurbitaria berberidis CBS 394.84]
MEAAKGVGNEVRNPAVAKAVWYKLSVNDTESLLSIANKIHPDLPESLEVFIERINLYPEGCLALIDEQGKGNKLYGYVISHPIIRRQPPALNSLLKEISPDADQYYIHDLAILSEARGCGFAQECISKLLAIAERFETTSLISVYDSTSFWGRFGFVSGESDNGLERKLRDYGEDAVYLERRNDNQI